MGKKSDVKKVTQATTSDINAVQLVGRAIRCNQMEKLERFTLDCVQITPNGKEAHAYIPVIWFNAESEGCVLDNERVSVSGSIRTGSYTNKAGATVYTVEVVADKVIFE